VRIRSIKPEFHKDKITGRWPLAMKMLFIGIWNFADDVGRFEWEPDLIRAEIFPYDPDFDVVGTLNAIVKTGRIIRYEINGQEYGQVAHFSAHQRLDHPKQSILPPPPPLIPETPGTHPAEMGASPENVSTDRIGLDRIGRDILLGPPAPSPESVALAWNETCGDVLPKVNAEKLGSARRQKLKTRCADGHDGPWWLAYFRRIRSSPFLCGETGWVASFDWAIRSELNIAKVLEGNYDQRQRAASPGGQSVRSTGPPAVLAEIEAIKRERAEKARASEAASGEGRSAEQGGREEPAGGRLA